ncbi:MAG: aminotransferase class I/II-fold pyridoxal phosphate-dependent enzyme [Gammaproteobacteria bacterium]|nr:aminotransferase class I/II-fold pyridoxal phosphate-dependent enzyme [Gammaproteobacteria bacterium]
MTENTLKGSHFRPSSRIQDIGVSEILKIVARARQLKSEGRPVIELGAGEPDFQTPENVKQAAIEAIHRGETQYTILDGSPGLKAAIQEKFARENALHFELNEITASAGAKQVLFNAFMATLEAGDEVIIPTPYWTSYEDIVGICGGRVVLVPCLAENGFLLQAEDLEKAITPRTKWVMINSPCNPTGAAYSADDYRPIMDVLLQYPNIWLLADDIYEHIIYDDFDFVTPVQVEPGMKNRVLTVNGVSKVYAMTGWRLGYAAGPAELIKAMAVIQSQSTSCPSSITQAAAIEALTGVQDFLPERRESFKVRRDMVVNTLNRIPEFDCPSPVGAFYTYAGCEGVLNRRTPDGELIETDTDFCRQLLEVASVAVVPGSAFGLSPFFRISYATSEKELAEALERILTFVSRLGD